MNKDNFVSMVVGAKGQTIKRIGTWARRDIEKGLGLKVFLKTHVKVKKNWAKNPGMMKELGYVINE